MLFSHLQAFPVYLYQRSQNAIHSVLKIVLHTHSNTKLHLPKMFLQKRTMSLLQDNLMRQTVAKAN